MRTSVVPVFQHVMYHQFTAGASHSKAYHLMVLLQKGMKCLVLICHQLICNRRCCLHIAAPSQLETVGEADKIVQFTQRVPAASR